MGVHGVCLQGIQDMLEVGAVGRETVEGGW